MNFNKYMQPGSYHPDKIIKSVLLSLSNQLPSPESEVTTTLISITTEGDSIWYHGLYNFFLWLLLLNIIFQIHPCCMDQSFFVVAAVE